MKNYLGVTGITNISDNIKTIENFVDAGINLENEHIPMIGFLVIPKTLYGIAPSKGKIPHQRYPPVSSLRYIMEYSKNFALNMIHFGAKDDLNIGKDIICLFDKTGVYEDGICKALQLNAEWPRKGELEKIINKFPETEIILQIPKTILENEKSRRIAEKLKDYGSLINGALIDPSGGKGRNFDLNLAVNLYGYIKEKNPKLIVGFAGGFNGTNVKERIIQIKRRVNNSDFSIDAEGGLRICEKDEKGSIIIDMLELNLEDRYIKNAKKAFNYTQKHR